MSASRVARLAGLAASCAVAVTMLAACGSSGKTPATAADTQTRGTTGFQAYLACLTQHGVTLPSQAARARPSFTFSRGARPTGSPGSGGFGGGRGFGGFGGGFGGGFDPNSPPAGVDQATWSAALTACQSLQPTFNGGGFNNSALTAYRNCLSDHGLNLSPGPGGFNFDTADAKIAAALKACAPLRPTGRPGGQPTPSPSPTT
ncbi:MAG TPA: hypothetical protein VKB69_00700 [Micromonosporaceae bacterium]|nr:hypothetical protein [Micromonosporaceae bacterium]